MQVIAIYCLMVSLMLTHNRGCHPSLLTAYAGDSIYHADSLCRDDTDMPNNKMTQNSGMLVF